MGKKKAGVPNPMKYKSMNRFTNPSSIIFSLFLIFLNIFFENNIAQSIKSNDAYFLLVPFIVKNASP